MPSFADILASRFTLGLGLLIVMAGGCSPEWYKQSADLDVQALLKDRKEQTLGYEPEVVAPATQPTTPARKAYDTVPHTPLPPATPPALEPSRLAMEFGPLGPVEFFPPGTTPPRFELMTEAEARQPGIDRLRLGPAATPPKRHRFELFDSLAYAVQNSRDYQTQMEDLYLGALEVTLARHLFAPRPFLRQTVDYNGGQADVNYRSALNAATSAGVRQQLPYGGEIVAEGLVDFVQALNDSTDSGESASVALSASVPLLRGAGMVNLEPLIRSERQLVYDVRTFEDFRRQFAVTIASRYFRLLSQQQAIVNRRFSYASNAALTERTLALFAAGRINFLQVQRSQQQQLQVENSLILAQEAYQADLDLFKILLGMPVEEEIDIVPIELLVEAPAEGSFDPIETALTFRLDLQTARDQIEDAQRAVQVAQSGLLPDLRFDVGGRIANPGGAPASNIDSQTLTYNAGFTLDLPVDRVAERNVYRRSLIALERSGRSFTQLRDQIVAAVRGDVRSIRAARLTVEIQRRGIELAQKRLDFSNELLVQGRSTDSRDVTDAQQSLLSAQDAYERAKADLQIQILQFLQDTGTLRVDPTAGTLGVAMKREAAATQPRAAP